MVGLFATIILLRSMRTKFHSTTLCLEYMLATLSFSTLSSLLRGSVGWCIGLRAKEVALTTRWWGVDARGRRARAGVLHVRKRRLRLPPDPLPPVRSEQGVVCLAAWLHSRTQHAQKRPLRLTRSPRRHVGAHQLLVHLAVRSQAFLLQRRSERSNERGVGTISEHVISGHSGGNVTMSSLGMSNIGDFFCLRLLVIHTSAKIATNVFAKPFIGTMRAKPIYCTGGLTYIHIFTISNRWFLNPERE